MELDRSQIRDAALKRLHQAGETWSLGHAEVEYLMARLDLWDPLGPLGVDEDTAERYVGSRGVSGDLPDETLVKLADFKQRWVEHRHTRTGCGRKETLAVALAVNDCLPHPAS